MKTPIKGRFRLCRLTLREANAFIARFHRHHKPVRGCVFVLGLQELDLLVGVAIVGRPVSRGCDWRTIAEVTRLCVPDGMGKHACSALYAAAARVARELGYCKVQTYILASEPGTSLRAAGWIREGEVNGRAWDHTTARQLFLDGTTRRQDQPTDDKVRWARQLAG